ncbi:hypothetical protein [Alteromonas lipotrueae]|uniref:hypothetical protein n=1 Tax=Alteromonas lipotrueae TaxID=2803814 RepID=UPI001C4776E5|nr:hypothetical protein [Alteromonas lipotrueae]
MRTILVVLLFLVSFSNAQEPAPLASCLSYEMNRIDKDTGKFVLQNVFAPQLFENLKQNFPDQDIDWSNWATSVDEYIGEDGRSKTKLKGCFDVSIIHENTELISSIMRISMTRFQAAMKFYSKPDTEHIPQNKVDSMLDGYEEVLKDPKVKQAIEKELKHNNQMHPTPNNGAAD